MVEFNTRLTADKLAREADFFSFGTNDLTQMTYGFSRDDIENLRSLQKDEHSSFDPFQHIDQEGVGELMRIATAKARCKTKPVHWYLWGGRR